MNIQPEKKLRAIKFVLLSICVGIDFLDNHFKKIFLPIFFVLFFYIAFLNYTEPTEIGIAKNVITGEMYAQEGGGWHVTPPWVWVSVIDTRPMRVAVTSGGRGYGAKLVQFDPAHWQEFVATEGWRYWWWTNRFSVNFGYDEEYRGMKDVMRGYAYGAKRYAFIKVLKEF